MYSLRQLNAVSTFDAYPISRIEALLHQVGQACYLSTLDLAEGYWQIPPWDTYKEKTAFSSPSGLYHFRKMPFGLHGEAATFQQLMDKVLQLVSTFNLAYIEDTIIFNKTWEEHFSHLRGLLYRLQENGLTANPHKCHLERILVKYLGYIVGRGQFRAQPDKIHALKQAICPQDKKYLQHFLGLNSLL